MMRTLLFLAIGLGSACGPAELPPPRLPTDTADCPAACAHLRALGCEEGQPLEDGSSCESFCEDTQNAGHALNPSCVKSIRRCEDLEPVCRK